MTNLSATKLLLTVAVVACAAQLAAAIQTSDLEETVHIKLDRTSFLKKKKPSSLRSGGGEYALYGYDGGPGTSNWDGVCASGTIQSPIDIEAKDAKTVLRTPLKLTGANQTPINTNITNSGHSIKIILKTAQPIQVSGGPFGNDTYEFQQMHFHWGKNPKDGSEHTVNAGKSHGLLDGLLGLKPKTTSFPFEAHAVFYKVGVEDPTQDGLAVLGTLFESNFSDNRVLETISKAVADIPLPNQFIVKPGGSSLLDYLPRNLDSYFNYLGSLTTPPCTEGVKWIVFTEKNSISERQVSEFRKMRDELGYNVIYNFRETQPLNGRTVDLVKSSGKAVY